jgi:hypothetical protein
MLAPLSTEYLNGPRKDWSQQISMPIVPILVLKLGEEVPVGSLVLLGVRREDCVVRGDQVRLVLVGVGNPVGRKLGQGVDEACDQVDVRLAEQSSEPRFVAGRCCRGVEGQILLWPYDKLSASSRGLQCHGRQLRFEHSLLAL